jgi:hypothetical protein
MMEIDAWLDAGPAPGPAPLASGPDQRPPATASQ